MCGEFILVLTETPHPHAARTEAVFALMVRLGLPSADSSVPCFAPVRLGGLSPSPSPYALQLKAVRLRVGLR